MSKLTSTTGKSINSNISGYLVLVRHAESEWNVLGKWTGRTDVHITEKGKHEAGLVGEAIKDIELNHAYTSDQIRTVETLICMLDKSEKSVMHERANSLNERDYGDYTGMNKWDVLEQLGEQTFNGIRRGWDHPIPGGETLQMVYERAVPFYKEHILPKLLAGQNVLVVSHGNTIRSLIKYLEKISDAGVADVEMHFGEILIYKVDLNGYKLTKESRQANVSAPKA
jgi:2,3-bisphosphoglycerate-dependent phosphoglycerate mutase